MVIITSPYAKLIPYIAVCKGGDLCIYSPKVGVEVFFLRIKSVHSIKDRIQLSCSAECFPILNAGRWIVSCMAGKPCCEVIP